MLHRRIVGELSVVPAVTGLSSSRRHGMDLVTSLKREYDMRLGKYLMAAAAATMAVAPAVAAPTSATSLASAKSARAGSLSANKSELAGGGGIVAVIAAVLVIIGIVIVADEKDSPRSP